MRRAVSLASIVILAALLGCQKMAYSPQSASAPASRLEIRLPEEGFVAGQAGQIEIRLIDRQGHPAPSAEAVTIELASNAALGMPETIELPAGSAGADVAVTPKTAGLVDIEARAKGVRLDPAYATAATLEAPKPTVTAPETTPVGGAAPEGATRLGTAMVLRELSLKDMQERPAGRWNEILVKNPELRRLEVQIGETAPATTEPTPTAPPIETPVPPATPEGRVVLHASPAEVVCGAGGWRPAEIDAFWTVGDKPIRTLEPIEISLTSTGRAGSVKPRKLTIPANGFQSEEPAVVVGRTAGKVEVAALYAGSAPASPLGIDVVADPGRLDLSGARKIRGLAVAHPTVTLRLVDPLTQLPLPVEQELKVDLEIQGDAGSENREITLAPGTNSGSATIDLERHGTYQLTARAACLDAGSLAITYGLDWALIAVAAGAGLLGSLISHRPRRTKSSAWQKAARLGGGAIIAGLFALGLASFGLLSFLEKLVPLDGFWTQLDGLPALSFTGAALTGFLAGFLSEKIWAKLRG